MGGPQEVIKTNVKEEDIKECAVIFGRMNPPTIGHKRLIEAAQASHPIVKVFLSHKTGKDDPLPYEQKLELAREAFGDVVVDSKAKNLFEALTELNSEFNSVTVYTGNDRIEEMSTRIPLYNKDLYDYENIKFESIDRDDISASNVRKAALDVRSIKNFLPENIQDKEDVIVEAITRNEFLSGKKLSTKDEIKKKFYDKYKKMSVQTDADDPI